MTRPDLESIRERCEKATAGPWSEGIDGNQRIYAPDMLGEESGNVASFARRKDVSFIAHARSDVPALLAYIAELEAGSSVEPQVERISVERALLEKLVREVREPWAVSAQKSVLARVAKTLAGWLPPREAADGSR